MPDSPPSVHLLLGGVCHYHKLTKDLDYCVCVCVCIYLCVHVHPPHDFLVRWVCTPFLQLVSCSNQMPPLNSHTHTHSYSHSLIHSHLHTYTLTHTLTHTHTHSHSHSLTHTFTHTHTLLCTLNLFLTQRSTTWSTAPPPPYLAGV